jgi:uroporphyrinogen decarboxylase
MSPVPRERFIAALERRPPVGRVPHFELVFFLTMEAFGRVHPSHRDYGQWLQMEERERELHRHDMADLYLATAARYEHDAIFLHPNPNTPAELARQVEIIREKSGDRYFLLAHGDATYAVPDGTHMEDFACRMVEDPAGLKAEAAAKVRAALDTAAGLRRPGGLDGFACAPTTALIPAPSSARRVSASL